MQQANIETRAKTIQPHTTISPFCGGYVAQFTRVGSELHSQPQYFRTETEARDFCRVHDLQVI